MKCKCMPRCATAAAVSEEQLSAASRASVLVKRWRLPRNTPRFLIHPNCYQIDIIQGSLEALVAEQSDDTSCTECSSRNVP